MMRTVARRRVSSLLFLSCLAFLSPAVVRGDQAVVVAGPKITSPPFWQTASFAQLRRRDNGTACSYGTCAGVCLSQGAFCCNPGGTLFPPNWICDNGNCITSVRGETGVVDCYDPDNPSGTTQSCIDFVPTTKCHTTDRCYTCSSDEPFCFWQTWIASKSPTLRWFSCVPTTKPDATFLAATITSAPTGSTTLSPSSTSATTLAPTSTSSTSSTATPIESNSPPLSTGAIAGIAIGGAGLLLAILALIIWLIRSRKPPPAAPTTLEAPQIWRPSPLVELGTPVEYQNSLAGSGSHSQGTAVEGEHWRYHYGSQPNLAGVMGDERWAQKTRLPVELPADRQSPSPRPEMRDIYRGDLYAGQSDGDDIGIARAY